MAGKADSKKYDRFARGGVILRQGMTEQYGQERIHQFARAIEALIKPAKSGTTKQFKNRPQTFGVSGSKMEKILYESYEMRCDVEHVHSPDKFLKNNYGEDEIETIATLRTRQMEVLSREAYRKILTNQNVRKHFETDDALDAFWALSNDARRQIWGDGVDVTGFADEDEYNEKVRQLREKYGY